MRLFSASALPRAGLAGSPITGGGEVGDAADRGSLSFGVGRLRGGRGLIDAVLIGADVGLGRVTGITIDVNGDRQVGVLIQVCTVGAPQGVGVVQQVQVLAAAGHVHEVGGVVVLAGLAPCSAGEAVEGDIGLLVEGGANPLVAPFGVD